MNVSAAPRRCEVATIFNGQTLPDLLPAARPGLLGIVGGQPWYEPPEGYGPYPIVEPGDGVDVYVNGRRITTPTVVFPRDELHFETPVRKPQLRVAVEVSSDGLYAVLVIERTPGARFRVADAPPAPRLRPRAVPDQAIAPPPVGWETVLEEIRRAGVRWGLDEAAARRLVEQANQDPRGGAWRAVIAAGQPAVAPRDARLQLVGELAPGALVVAGQPLAQKLPASPGCPGRTVRDEPIPVPEPRDPPLVAGPGATLTPDGMAVVASRGGRLAVRGFTVWVQNLWEIPGDVGPGLPVRFPGDVVVLGQCLQGSEVVAGGRLEVRGGVDTSRLQAVQGIATAGGVFRSTLLAGAVEGAELGVVAAELRLVSAELERLASMVRAAVERTGLAESEVAARVLDLRGSQLRQALARLRQFPRPELLPEGLVERLVAQLTGLGGVRRACCSLWLQLKEPVEAALSELEGQEGGGAASIRVPYAHNSTLKASDPIWLTGRGSYHCQLHAGTGIEVPQGTLMGGHAVVLAGPIRCHTLGGGCSVTHVTVSPGFFVSARVVLPDVVVQVGGRKLVVTEAHRDVAFVLQDDRVVAVPSKALRAVPAAR